MLRNCAVAGNPTWLFFHGSIRDNRKIGGAFCARKSCLNVLEFTLLVWAGSFAAGFLGALTGLGGGVVIVPLLTLAFKVDLQYAIGASLVSVIAVPDLVYNATLINADTYRPLEVYTIVALIYFAILFPATLLGRHLERGMTYDKA